MSFFSNFKKNNTHEINNTQNIDKQHGQQNGHIDGESKDEHKSSTSSSLVKLELPDLPLYHPNSPLGHREGTCFKNFFDI